MFELIYHACFSILPKLSFGLEAFPTRLSIFVFQIGHKVFCIPIRLQDGEVDYK